MLFYGSLCEYEKIPSPRYKVILKFWYLLKDPPGNRRNLIMMIEIINICPKNFKS